MSETQHLSDHEKASRSLFNYWAKSYDRSRISSWFQYTQHMAIDLLECQADSRVLDVGCGTGYATRMLAQRLPRGRACGIDIAPEMIEQARAKVTEDIEERIEFVPASSADLPYGDDTFSHIICTNSFHHYPDPMEAFKEMQRVLTPQGQVVIFENAPDMSWYTWCWDRFLRIVEKGHVRYYPSYELGQMIRDAGFDDVELKVLRNEFMKHRKLFASIQVWSAKNP